jgi:hypothetical protein
MTPRLAPAPMATTRLPSGQQRFSMSSNSSNDPMKEHPAKEEALVDFISRTKNCDDHDDGALVAADVGKKEAAAATATALVPTGSKLASDEELKEMETAKENLQPRATKEDVEDAKDRCTPAQQPRLRRSSRIEERRAAEAAAAAAAAQFAPTTKDGAIKSNSSDDDRDGEADGSPEAKKRNVGKARAIVRSPRTLLKKRPKAAKAKVARQAHPLKPRPSPVVQPQRNINIFPRRFLFSDDDSLLMPRPPPLRPNHLGEHFVRVPEHAAVGPNFAFLTPMSDLTPSDVSSAGAIGGSNNGRRLPAFRPTNQHRRASGISDVTMTVAIMPRDENARNIPSSPGVLCEPPPRQSHARVPLEPMAGAAGANSRSQAASAPTQPTQSLKPPPRPAASKKPAPAVPPMAAPARAAAASCHAAAPNLAPARGQKGQPPRRRPRNLRTDLKFPLLSKPLVLKKKPPPPPGANTPADAMGRGSPDRELRQQTSPQSASALGKSASPRPEGQDEGEDDRIDDP